ncbi:NAD(P)-dependent oxidoreductase [Pseudoalteromonas arctica]|uniref:NAD(P)-dependent oxidoreductase n=1 Tax=Pseudoalteromonas arctica TaxID=394751 RepID=A0A7X9U5Q7_9GAMM|nr:NAD(P)-dependent oxidoreductase [Pseudoalteromonas arctica]NMF48122.1 NAD(P)-dependent oxidoreductase [Pseudoalteromonas arctica]
MKVAITGATGLLGKAFIKKYAKELEIIAISRKPNIPDTVYSDFSFESLTRIFSGVDGLIHFAAQRLHSSDSYISNYELDKTVFLSAKKSKVKNVLFSSSRGVYGTASAPWKETSQVAPNNLYALEKAQSELFASFLNMTCDMRIKCLRVAQVLSENEYKGSMIHTFIGNAHRGIDNEVSVEGIFREYIYIEDLLDAFYIALQHKDLHGIYNVGTGNGISILDIAKCISKSFDKNSKVFQKKKLKKIVENSVMDISLFTNAFSWKPRYTFDTAMHEIANKVKNNDT